MSYPAWVSEGSVKKYDRAVLELKKENKEVTEEAVKALYVKYNGLVLDVEAKKPLGRPKKVKEEE